MITSGGLPQVGRLALASLLALTSSLVFELSASNSSSHYSRDPVARYRAAWSLSCIAIVLPSCIRTSSRQNNSSHMATAAQKRVNLIVSRIIPPVLLGAVVYASYAITKTLCSG